MRLGKREGGHKKAVAVATSGAVASNLRHGLIGLVHAKDHFFNFNLLPLALAHIRPDVNPGMNGLLKEQPGSQLFTVFGRPRAALDGPDGDGMYRLTMEGVDI